jgi:hypothetical protein
MQVGLLDNTAKIRFPPLQRWRQISLKPDELEKGHPLSIAKYAMEPVGRDLNINFIGFRSCLMDTRPGKQRRAVKDLLRRGLLFLEQRIAQILSLQV